MRTKRFQHAGAGFSLIEIMIAVSIMTLILFGLYSIFSETQRAMVSNANQVDVLDKGRGPIESMARDIRPALAPNVPGSEPHFQINLYTNTVAPSRIRPLFQDLPDGTRRTNVLHDLFFMVRDADGNWEGRGYMVHQDPQLAPVGLVWGTLHRIRIRYPKRRLDAWGLQQIRRIHGELRKRPLSDWSGQMRMTWVRDDDESLELTVATSALIEGVVHFRCLPLDSGGRPMRYFVTNALQERFNPRYLPGAFLFRDDAEDELLETRAEFFGQALPAALDVEIGFLDPAALGRIRSLENHQLAHDHLEKNPGAVNLFRRLVPIVSAGEILPQQQASPDRS